MTKGNDTSEPSAFETDCGSSRLQTVTIAMTMTPRTKEECVRTHTQVTWLKREAVNPQIKLTKKKKT